MQPEVEAWVAGRAPALLRYAYLLTGDPHAAQDLVQDALATVVGRWEQVAATDDPDRYVRRMIANGRVSAWRRFGRRVVVVPAVEEDAGRPGRDPADDVVRRDAVWQVCRALPPRQRAAVVLRYYEDLPDDEIARVLGCSAATVRSQVHRALATLRRELTREEASDG